MNLRCLFHVSPLRAAPTPPARTRAPSVAEIEVDVEERAAPRGCSAETWARARGWSSED